jgi:hypothetical protein
MPATRTAQVFGPVLARLHADAERYFGVGPLLLGRVADEERPASYLLRLSVRRPGDAAVLSHLFVKVFKPKSIDGGLDAMRQRVARDFDTTRQVFAAMRGDDRIGVVPPVACYPDLLAMATEQVTGVTLLERLEADAPWFPSESRLHQLLEIMATTGRWIRVFQGSIAGGGCATADGLRAYIDHRLQRLVRADATFTVQDRARVLRHIDSLGAQLSATDLQEVAIHSDLGPGNVLVSGRRIVVLDFGMTKLGTRLHDLTRLYAQIELLSVKPWYRPEVIAQLQRALIAGFDPALSVDRPLFRLLLLLHRVNHLTSLTVTRARVPEAFYNRLVSRQHRRRIASELVHDDTAQTLS